VLPETDVLIFLALSAKALAVSSIQYIVWDTKNQFLCLLLFSGFFFLIKNKKGIEAARA
jgi:hypothetical protein